MQLSNCFAAASDLPLDFGFTWFFCHLLLE
uniref:Uncharacterized protein n=1 Tax=Rhizophora mucronata TaxID=61149 RepID=A0A2P2Q266_RHIMU